MAAIVHLCEVRIMTRVVTYGKYSLALALLFPALISCNKAPESTAAAQTQPADPASGNLAPAADTDQTQAAPQTYAQAPQQPAPAQPQPYGQAPSGSYDQNSYSQNSYPADYPQGYPDSGTDTAAYYQPVQASDPPPPLPDYSQPECPGDNYMWTPGYWAYASDGYYWVPGAWVLAPWVGALWTPPYWGYGNGSYLWHAGFWGLHIGFYGGINYGFGYTGRGYYGAYWNNGSVLYNRSVTNVNITVVHNNVYNYSVPNAANNRVSYNGGRGGISARPTPQEAAVVRDPRSAPVPAQVQQMRAAASNRAQFARGGQAHPATLVSARPLQTSYHAPAARPPAVPRPAQVPNQPRPGAPNSQAMGRPGQPVAPQQAQNRPGVSPNHPEAQPAGRAPVQARQEPHPAAPVPTRAQARQPEPAPRPLPQARPEPTPRAVPQARPEPAPRPAPQARREPAPRPAPQAARPAPAPRPAPQARPEPAPRPAPQARPEPRPAAAPRPAPQSHPAPHPAPERKPEEKKQK
jgi:hypothetical protein